MRYIDRVLQKARIRKAKIFIPPGSYVLDIGCSDGTLFDQLNKRISGGIGIDLAIEKELHKGKYVLYPGNFPNDFPSQDHLFDVITLLAVVEHIPVNQQTILATGCAVNLQQGGRVIVTAPSPFVDKILDLLLRFNLIDGMSLEQHFGFEPKLVPTIFLPCGFRLIDHKKFQFGLNNIFVFEKQ